ncbi:MAG: hypothetical protein MUC42_14515 [Bryobacter sp.]|nr:hypothetical protein [Bryobacter sp.]
MPPARVPWGLTSPPAWRLKPHGRLGFTVYHPDLAAAGKEANFEKDGIEYRLGAERHTAADYLDRIAAAGFTRSEHFEFTGDSALAAQVPGAQSLLDRNVLLAVKAHAATST